MTGDLDNQTKNFRLYGVGDEESLKILSIIIRTVV